MDKKKILILCFNDLKKDPRVSRQIELLTKEYHITTIALKKSGFEDEFIEIKKLHNKINNKLFGVFYLVLKMYQTYYNSTFNFEEVYKKISAKHYDLIISNDLNTLPFGVKISKIIKSKIIFDAHEYFPEEHNHKLYWRMLFKKYNIYLLKNNIKNINQMWSVSSGICNEYEKKYFKPVHLITNAPDKNTIKPTFNEGKVITVIHHGNADKARHIENMIDTIGSLSNKYALDLMLMANNSKRKKYLKKLKLYSKKYTNIRFINTVTKDEIIPFINKYDIGFYILSPINFNHQHALPNKIFEFIQAKLAIAIAPSLEMKKIIEKYNIGIVSKDFTVESMIESLAKLEFKEINNYKKNTLIAAEELNSKINKEKMLKLVGELMG